MKELFGPLTKEKVRDLRCAQEIAYTGILYTARDQAHKRLTQMLKRKKVLPFSLKNQLLYYCGPAPAAPGKVIGACGPTTSGRMDEFTPALLAEGLLGVIGKGERSAQVIKALKQYQSVYFVTYAGCGALLAQYVKKKRSVCFGDLGAEAVFALEVERFPLITAIDTKGGNIYD